MIRFLFRFLVFLPLIEVVLIILVWRAWGPWWTLGLLFSGSLAGLSLLRRFPVRTLAQVRALAQRGQPPDRAIWEGMAQGIAGLLLLVPGFFSDFLAFLVLLGLGWRRLWRPRPPAPPASGSSVPGSSTKEPLEGQFRTYRD
ncbi:MAG TPA: FxsA family protein [Acidiferrobacter sp.]|nr:FxsA family protein [Acidiferrobacter sp.]